MMSRDNEGVNMTTIRLECCGVTLTEEGRLPLNLGIRLASPPLSTVLLEAQCPVGQPGGQSLGRPGNSRS